MSFLRLVTESGLVKTVLDHGGSIHTLIIPADRTNGTGLMNPSIYLDGDQILCNIRHVNYTLYHSENKKFQHRYGPLQYLHPENDKNLRTWNYLAWLDRDLNPQQILNIDTSGFDQDPLWEFVGLEDGRLQRWNGELYLCGVRRDTTTFGQGRMELSKLEIRDDLVREVERTRIPSTGDNLSYCEKNWMPILDQPFHFVKWTNPAEIVRFDSQTNNTQTVKMDPNYRIDGLPDLRGGSQVLAYGDYYLAVTHEVSLFKSEHGQKDARYRHRFVVWDRDWRLVKATPNFSFMAADIEFCCGAAWLGSDLLLSFGYQDNAAFVLKIPRGFLDQLLWGKDQIMLGLDWGNMQSKETLQDRLVVETFDQNIYEQYFAVEPGDQVVDVGSGVGHFLWKIAPHQPARVLCLESDPQIFSTLGQNSSKCQVPCELINSLIDPHNLSWSRFREQYALDNIDFLKVDCGGAEYGIFDRDNYDWISTNVRKIFARFNFGTRDLKHKFREFRDLYLRDLTSHKVQTLDGASVKHNLWSDWFIDYYSSVNVWIDNRIPLQQKRKWQHHPSPTLEITTTIPEKGCAVDCVFCPQRLLVKQYQGNRVMSLDDFQRWIDKVPREVRITFSGFVEPWLNKHCTDMVLYAHDQGHPVSVFTTGIGMSVEDIKALTHIPFAGDPNGGFVFHLPDSELLAKHPITLGYVRLCEWLKENQHRIHNFRVMCMGDQVHFAVKHCFPYPIPRSHMWDRAGNLSREAILKPQLLEMTQRWNRVQASDGARTCGCIENLYHNVLLPNGDVSLCCMDYGLDHILGNLDSSSYESVIPQVESCFDICGKCENAAYPGPTPRTPGCNT